MAQGKPNAQDNVSSSKNQGYPTSLADINRMIEKCSSFIPPLNPSPRRVLTGADRVVLLTGSTGALGADFLNALVRDDRIKHIFTLNRAPAVVDRQRAALKLRELDPAVVLSSKVTSLEGDVSLPDLGLEDAVLEKLRSSITHVIHSAWLVRFNAQLSEFEGYIAGTCRLLELAASSSKGAQLIYVSSIGSAQFWNSEKLGFVVPEEAHTFPEASRGLGYTESKYVMEHVLSRAIGMGHRASVLRLGQICGSTETGVWPLGEWIPIMIKTGYVLGCLPSRETDVAWVPDNILSGAILDYVTAAEPLPDFMNFVHPRPSPWSEVFGGLGDALGGIPVVPIMVWISKLEALAKTATAEDYRRAPALKILPLFRSMAEASRRDKPGRPLRFVSEKAQRFSATLRNVSPITREHSRAWVKYWERQGFVQIPDRPITSSSSKL